MKIKRGWCLQALLLHLSTWLRHLKVFQKSSANFHLSLFSQNSVTWHLQLQRALEGGASDKRDTLTGLATSWCSHGWGTLLAVGSHPMVSAHRNFLEKPEGKNTVSQLTP